MLEMIIDTREKENKHITNIFENYKIKYISQKMDFCDYSFYYEGINYKEKIVIERKNSIDELCINFTSRRTQFKKEFERSKDLKAFTILLVEDDYNKIDKHQYRSKMHPNSLKGSLESFKEKYNLHVIFCKKENTAKIMYNLFCRYIKLYLLKETA